MATMTINNRQGIVQGLDASSGNRVGFPSLRTTAAMSPIEAALTWTIGKRRRAEGGFPGADIILEQIKSGTSRRRVGLVPEGRAPAREGAAIVDSEGRQIGTVTSGGFGPSLNVAIAMGYVETAQGLVGQQLGLIVRGKRLEADVVKMPFVAHRYFKN